MICIHRLHIISFKTKYVFLNKAMSLSAKVLFTVYGKCLYRDEGNDAQKKQHWLNLAELMILLLCTTTHKQESLWHLQWICIYYKNAHFHYLLYSMFTVNLMQTNPKGYPQILLPYILSHLDTTVTYTGFLLTFFFNRYVHFLSND